MPTFTVRPGVYFTPTGDPAKATQRWHRNGAEIPGAIGTSYTTVSPADDGKLIEYVENVSNSAGTAEEQRLTLQALAAPTGIITGGEHYLPDHTSASRSVEKYTFAQRLFTNGTLIDYERIFGITAVSILSSRSNFFRFASIDIPFTITSIPIDSINTEFVSILLSVDHLNSGDLGSGVVAKLRVKGASVDGTASILAPGSYTPGGKTFTSFFLSQAGTTSQLQGWSYYHEGAALDPDTYWGDFFDSSGMPKEITSAWPADITPSFYLPAVASSWTSNANDGADSSFGWAGPALTDV